MIKLLIVHCDGAQKGGVVTFLRDFINSLDKNKFEPWLIFLRAGELVEEFRNKGFPVRLIPSERFRYLPCTLATIIRITQIIRREGISVVFSNGGKEHLYGGTAAYMMHRPSVWYCHTVTESLDILTKFVDFVPTNLILANSAYTKSFLSGYFKAPIQLIYLGIKLPIISKVSPNSIWKEFRVKPDAPLITAVGLFVECKGQEFFIRAAPKIVKEFPEAKFLLVGDATRECDRPFVEKLRGLVKKLYLEDRVIFTGFRQNAVSIMAASDIVVHASSSPETFGLVVTEAMSVDKPVIATGIGALGEIVVHGKTGILVPPKDADAIASACIKLLKNPKLRDQMGSMGGKRVEKYFTAERMAREIEDVLTGLVRGKG